MSINLTDDIEVKTKKGKLGAAKQIFLEGDTQTVENEIKDINSRHSTLSSTVTEHTAQINDKQQQITANKSAQDAKNASLDENMVKLNTRDDQITETLKNISVTGGASVASAVTYDNTTSQLTSANIQGAVDELQGAKIDKTSILQESGKSEDKVMSQKAVSDKLSDLSIKVSTMKDSVNTDANKDEYYIVDIEGNVIGKFNSEGLSTIAVKVLNKGQLTDILALIENKQDCEEGKGLSSNDFTDVFKDKIVNLPAISNNYEDSFYITDSVGNVFLSIEKVNEEYVFNYYGKNNDISSDWNGKTIATYGDSVTAINNGNHTYPYKSADVSDKWGVRVADYYRFAKHYGRGIGGQTFVWGANGGALSYVDKSGDCPNIRISSKTYDDYLNGNATIPEGYIAIRGALSSWVRITNMFPSSIKDDIDVITIMCHNDATVSSSIQDADVTFVEGSNVDKEWASSSYYSTYGGDYNLDNSVRGAICSTIMKLQAWIPNAVIVLMTPISGRGKEGELNVNLTDATMQNLAKACRDVHDLISVPLIDVYASDGINGLNRTRYIKDGIHPYLEDGKKMVARAIIGGLKYIIPNFKI